jgi:hypothetical protein
VPRRASFWPLIVIGALLEAAAAALLATAIFSDPIPTGSSEYRPETETDVFSRVSRWTGRRIAAF